VASCASQESSIEISWRRPELAKDSSNTVDVISREIDQSGINPASSVCCVYAPNPFLSRSALEVGHSVLKDRQDINYVTPVTTYPFPVQRSLGFNATGETLSMSEPEYLLVHSQKLESRFHETAQFWWGKGSTWLAKSPMQMKIVGIYTPRWMTQDIDTLEDWKQAEIRWKILDEEGSLSSYRFTRTNILTQENFFE
jgi:N-acylneuraminate cytidylyltransferase